MLLDGRDLKLLRLAGRYRWLPYEQFSRLEFPSLLPEIELLMKTGYLGLSQKKRYIKLSPQGYETLMKRGYNYDPGSKRAFASSSALRRRLEVSSIMLTALRAGIDVLQDNVEGLSRQSAFYPAFDLRDGETNLMNAASCAGFGHWGNKGYMLQYVSPQSPGMYQTNELKHLHNLSSLFDLGFITPLAMIFAGPSYREVHERLRNKVPSSRHGKKGFLDFWDVYQKSELPIHLLSCDETGATQLALMKQPDYNARIARAAFGERWTPRDDILPEADGVIDGNRPLIIAADMDIQRVARTIADAKRIGAKEVLLAAFKSQMEELLMEAFPRDGMVVHLRIDQPVLTAAFGKSFSLYSMDDTDEVTEGGQIHA